MIDTPKQIAETPDAVERALRREAAKNWPMTAGATVHAPPESEQTPDEKELVKQAARIQENYAVMQYVIQKQLSDQEQQAIGAALQAFETLFRYYSLNEELWRLERWMDGLLPYSLEEHPQMAHFRAQLTKQVGHLRGPDGDRITIGGVANWYANGSPLAGVDEAYATESTKLMLPPRFEWLIAQCRANGFKRVAEYGSVEGISLFHLLHHAPDIEWHGFESSLPAVKRGNELATKVGMAEKFNLHPMEAYGKARWHSPHAPFTFDACALFEVLEHNPWEGGVHLIRQAVKGIRPGGTLFITTPYGNWSAFDKHTQDLNLPKDHILAFTPARMLKLLTQALGPGEQEAARVMNPNRNENNSWVFAARKVT